jgi:hypothetical protein
MTHARLSITFSKTEADSGRLGVTRGCRCDEFAAPSWKVGNSGPGRYLLVAPPPHPPGLLKSCGEEGIAAAAATIAERAGRG